MKFHALSLIWALTAPSNVNAQATYVCPSAGSISLPISPADGVTTIRLPRVSPSDALCLLTRRNAATGGERVTASRSYAGRDWERSAGTLAKTGSGVVVDCTQGSATECDVTLPALDQGFEYILESHTYGISEEAEATRFLEQATFGATRETIDAMTASSNDFASWVEDQLALPVGSHREFYRSHTNPKFEFAYKVGATGPRPCELHSRWRRYAITSLDQLSNRKTGWNKHLTIELKNGKYFWKVDDQLRTVTATLPIGHDLWNIERPLELDLRYKITFTNRHGGAWNSDCIGCPVSVRATSGSTEHLEIVLDNPEVSVAGFENTNVVPYNVVDLPVFKSNDLPTIENSDEYPLFSDYVKPFENALLNTTSLEESNQCDDFPTFRKPYPLGNVGTPPGYFPTVFGRSADGTEFAYDPHFNFYENTVDNPLMDGGGQLVMDTYDVDEVAGKPVLCQNVERSSLNEDGCKLSFQPNVCSPHETPNEVIEITEANLNGINALTGRKLYALTGLPFTDDVDSNGRAYLKSPCVKSTSRWVRKPDDAVCANTANLGETTLKTFSDLISSRGMRTDINYNPNVVDVFRSIRDCDAADDTKLELGNVPAGDGTCWKHVHPLELSVLDLTSASTTKYTKISGPKVTIKDMVWLYGEKDTGFSTYKNIGVLDEHHVPTKNSLFPLSDAAVQDSFKSLDFNPNEAPVLVCGSPKEVASDPFYGDRGFSVVVPEGTGFRNWGIHDYSTQRHTVWTTLALKGVDQLRQKMAWNLSQIIAVGLPGSGGTFNEVTEHYIAFYDMFVNHAFGNYRELMQEFSFNLLVGKWLDYEDNKSLQYNIDKSGSLNHPDENFAREIMQLFSLGLYKMNMDGTYIMKENGLADETYSFDDIVSYARAWTGFSSRKERGGVSVAERQWNDKIIDPMRMKGGFRDKFPKNNLQEGYIGDHVALCEDLPAKHFLRKGATYYALGSKPNPEFHHDSEVYRENPDHLRLRVLPSSPLYAKLCASDINGDCTLPSKVVLDENLVYDAATMLGDEYAVDTIKTVELSVGLANPIYYKYKRLPCVEHSFFDNAKKVTQGVVTDSKIIGPSFCGNPKLSIATPMCASSDWQCNKIYCHYQGERVTYAGAEALCAANGGVQSHPWNVRESRSKSGPCVDGINDSRSWANAWCSVQAKIDFESGYIAIVNEVEPDHAGMAQVELQVSSATLNFFKTFWTEGIYPSDMNTCLNLIAEGASCVVHEGKSCICDTTVVDSTVFASADSSMSIDQLLMDLRTGAVDPSTFDSGTYNPLNCGIEGVTVYSKSGDCSSLASDSIFAFTNKNKAYFLKNMRSTVHISGSNDYSFRNPVQFINLVDPEDRDMYYETDAVLDSLFYHPTHPPFMATRIIQRFGISNPSPGFIERVATAYATGSYDNGRYGSGSYGDLGALVAAIILDDETCKPVLDSDPAHGHIREPLVKVLSFFRSMGASFEQPLLLTTLMSLESRIGQGNYEPPSVFSFFLTEYTPNVPALQTAGLVAPESMVLSGDNLLELHEGIFGMVKFGLKTCYKDYLAFYRIGLPWKWSCDEEGDTETATARTTYWPPSTASVDDILDDLSMLLTSGRLSPKNRAVIKSVVEPEFNTGNVAKSIRMAQQLLFATPEFHSTTVTRNTNEVRELSGYTAPPAAPYKAVVLLMLLGGADSWNLLVPHSNCAIGNQYQEYKNARGGSRALSTSDLEQISAASSDQNCNTFGVTKDLAYLAELYNNGELTFFPNAGILAKTVTKHEDWNGETPFQLGAHNSMVHEFYRNDAFNQRPNSGVFGRMADQLKLKGYHTATNAAGAGSSMLTGNPFFNNPVRGVTTKNPDSLNKVPTVENIYEIVKELNGVGQQDNGAMSEAWSSRVASGLFEHEEAIEFAQLPQLSDHTYPGEGSLNERFGAVMKSMKSRGYRKVNREFYVVKHDGYDHHGSNDVSGKFKSVNDAITNFVGELKISGLYESTVLVMGSDFGRSLNPNSNGGSDHAWGGNYFMLGGSVRGGKILGRYPQPLTPDHPNWIGRGRFIPTTSWDAVWNGIGQWMGLHDEDELNEAIPNRGSFDTCTELFSDKDLFINGACTCSGCETVTWPPTTQLTSAPTQAPHTIYQAEDQTWDSSGKHSQGNSGWTGSGYANMGGKGSWVQFNTVDAGAGGACTLGFRYSTGSDLPRSCTLKVNGVNVGTVTFSSTVSWDAWKTEYVETTCVPGNNIIRITASTSEGGPNFDRMDFLTASTSTSQPTNRPSMPVPTNLPTPKPTSQPTSNPTPVPSLPPMTAAPTVPPPPTPLPTPLPTPVPSAPPTNLPSSPPTPLPTFEPGTIVNLALQPGAVASQSSTCLGGEASRAIDGNTNNNWANNSIQHTCADNPPWWMVDLGAVSSISSVSIYNRWDSWSSKKKIWFSNVEILDEALNVVTSQPIGGSTQEVYTFDFGGVQGRYVRVKKTMEGDLNIAEVEVMGSSSTPTSPTVHPTPQQSAPPTPLPTPLPTPVPSAPPTSALTAHPTPQQTAPPTPLPTPLPTPVPSAPPTSALTAHPTPQQSAPPTPLPTPPPTSNPTNAPTPNPTADPTPESTPNPVTSSPTEQPTPKPVTSTPTSVPTHVPTPATGAPEGGTESNNILTWGTSFSEAFGGCSTNAKAIHDRTTAKYACGKSGGPAGWTVTPGYEGKMSVVKALRFYSQNDCPNCDVVAYKLEGRANASSSWNVIGEGDLPWKGVSTGRNDKGLPINLSFESADPARVSTEVTFPSNTNAYLQYRLSFTETRDPNSSWLVMSEVELPGYLF